MTNISATSANNYSRRLYLLSNMKRADVACPKCGSKEVEQRGFAFTVITSKKSA